MKILAVDPGYERVGFAVLEKEKNGPEVWVHSETFKTNKETNIRDRLFEVGERVDELCKEYECEALTIEKLFFNNNQKTAMFVAEARGIIMHVAMQNGLKVREFTPLEIKAATTGHGRADKNQMILMVTKLIKLPEGKRLDDEYDAIACGLTYFAYHKLNDT